MDECFVSHDPNLGSYAPSLDSDTMLKYRNQILLDDNIDENSIALKAAESSFYEALKEKPPSSHQAPLFGSPDSILGSSSGYSTSSSSIGNYNTDPRWIVEPGESKSSVASYPPEFSFQSSSQSNSHRLNDSLSSFDSVKNTQMDSSINANSVPNIFSDTESILLFKKGMDEASRFLPSSNQLVIDLDKYSLPLKTDELTRDTVIKIQQNGASSGKRQGDDSESVDLLTSCSQSVVAADYRTANEQLNKSRQHSSPTGLSSKYVSAKGGDSRNSSSSSSVLPTPRSEGEILQSPNLKSFTFADLKMATGNFRADSFLGEGGFGSVFKGWLYENSLVAAGPGTGIEVAVKKLNQEGYQGHREWLAEVNYLGQLCHPNLVKLIGYCLEDEHRLLVYEFMPKGSLEKHIFRRGSHFQPLSWYLRLKVALGAAKGLAFLHSAETQVIYRDFKAYNILLDSSYNAKLSDFGLAKDGPTGDNTHVSTRIMGTYGYADPEYLATGHLSAKSDVYSFGVVLLELLSGRRAIDKNKPYGAHNLVEWAKPYMSSKRRLLRILDNRLEGQYTLEVAQKVANLAERCLSREPKFRPSMDGVVKELEQLKEQSKV